MENKKKEIRDQLDHYVGLTTEPQDRQLCPPACHTQPPSWFHGGYTRCSSYCPLGGAPERETHTQTLYINFNQSALQNKHTRNESCVTDRLLVLVHRCSTELQKRHYSAGIISQITFNFPYISVKLKRCHFFLLLVSCRQTVTCETHHGLAKAANFIKRIFVRSFS